MCVGGMSKIKLFSCKSINYEVQRAKPPSNALGHSL